jgi:WhiB family redox-sensing transcriptional regulator
LSELIERAPELTWLDDAACGNLPLDQLPLFFVEAGRTIAAETKALCRGCPVRHQCLDHAYAHQIASGYFGGISPGRRRALTHAEARELVTNDTAVQRAAPWTNSATSAVEA